LIKIHKNPEFKFIKFRETLYELLIYNLNITECVWYILNDLFDNNVIVIMPELLIKTYSFLKYYNNNYRPIYHLEKYFLYIVVLCQ
jgi:hypothetical protein